MDWADPTIGKGHTRRRRDYHIRGEHERLVRRYIVNLENAKPESNRNIIVLPEKIKRRPIRDNGLDHDLLRGGTHQTLIEVHLASLCSRGRNLYMKPAQSDLVKCVWMKNQGCPGTNHGHSIDGGQGRYTRIAVPVKNQSFCYVSWVGKICTVIAFHVHPAAKGLLQQRMHLTISERPKSEHQRDASNCEAEGPEYNQLKDGPSKF